jgi:cytoskeletal protein CcmA (bactofilin family)
MWVKGGTFGIGTTDAFLINYAVGIGSTNVPLDAYAAIGANHIYERSINTPNLTVAENAVVSGILTGTTFDSETAIIDNLQVTGTTTTGQLNVTGVSTFQGNVNLGDNDRLILGDSQDLQIWHTGSNSIIRDNGTGDLFLAGDNNVRITNAAFTETKAIFTSNGAVELYYDNSKKFETTGVGVTVYGNTETQTLNVTGVSTVTGIATFQSDVYIDGNLNVKGDLTYDEVRGRNLSISGVGTIANIEIGTASTNTINTLSGALTLNSEIGFNVAISTHTNVVGYLSATDGIYYEVGDFNGPNGIAYFDSTGLLVSSASTVSAASTSNYLLTTNATGVPVWTNVFEGGSF